MYDFTIYHNLHATQLAFDEDLRPVHNTTLHNVLRSIAFGLTLVGTQRNARIDSDPILALHSCTRSSKTTKIFS